MRGGGRLECLPPPNQTLVLPDGDASPGPTTPESVRQSGAVLLTTAALQATPQGPAAHGRKQWGPELRE